ncbi:hypothetical protein JGS22_001755 [Streptomyces sp. P38-E01]|uniref:DUF397 domain-containing protein n=1 Tax=Streptomyces tardus TaxID=2780544 RepID=A0A949JAX9_9ACTN|nr:hypothetical protein [Streptomyces tardus]
MPHGPVLLFPASGWASFVSHSRASRSRPAQTSAPVDKCIDGGRRRPPAVHTAA